MVNTGADRSDQLLAGGAAQGRWTEVPERSPVTVIDTLVLIDNLAEREKAWAAFGADPG